MIEGVRLMRGGCLELMASIPDGSVDMVMCDLPYGTTQNSWDSVLPLDQLWAHYWRVLKRNGAAVLTAQPPFDKVLGASCLKRLKYEWIWEKQKATGHLNCLKQPMKAHENILVFYDKQCVYNPQLTEGKPYSNKHKPGDSGTNYGAVAYSEVNGRVTRYPRSVQQFSHVSRPEHPTQKPVALMDYLIRTYTNPGDVVLDNCMGSGTTGVAALECGWRFVGIEKDEKYFEIAERRIKGCDAYQVLYGDA